jgi:hypothetical protein
MIGILEDEDDEHDDSSNSEFRLSEQHCPKEANKSILPKGRET